MFKKSVVFCLASHDRDLNSPRTVLRSQTRPQAAKHYADKVEYIRTNVDTLEETIQKKRENMNYLTGILQQKIQVETQGGPTGKP